MGSGSSLPYEIIPESKKSFRHPFFDIHYGYHKTTKEKVTIFSFNKTNHISDTASLSAADNFLNTIKTIRFPYILRYIESFDNDDIMHIVTESVEQMTPDFYPFASNPHLIALGLYQLSSAVHFLTNDCGLIHCNIHPSSIFFDSAGNWKLGGFELCYPGRQIAPQNTRMNIELCPHQYQCPQVFSGEWSSLPQYPIYSIDAWSIGCVIYAIFYSSFSSREQLNCTDKIPRVLLSCYRRLINIKPNYRLTPIELKNNSYINIDFVQSFQFLEELALKTPQEKETFFTNLFQNILTYPETSCKNHFLPKLTSSLDFCIGSSPSILSVILKIGSILDHEEYSKYVVPAVVSQFSSNERSVRISLLKHLDQYIEHLDSTLINEQLFNPSKITVVSGFSDTSPLLREITIKSMIFFVPKLDENKIVSQILPYLAALQNDKEPGIRTNTVVCLSKLCTYFSPSIQKKVIPGAFLKACKDTFVPTRISALKAISLSSTLYSINDIVNQIIPSLLPYTVDSDQVCRESCLSTIEVFINILKKNSQTLGEQTHNKNDFIPEDHSVTSQITDWAINSIKTTLFDSNPSQNTSTQSSKIHKPTQKTPSTNSHSPSDINSNVNTHTSSIISEDNDDDENNDSSFDFNDSVSTLLLSTTKTEKKQIPSSLSNDSGWDDFFNDFNDKNTQVKPISKSQQLPKINELSKKHLKKKLTILSEDNDDADFFNNFNNNNLNQPKKEQNKGNSKHKFPPKSKSLKPSIISVLDKDSDDENNDSSFDFNDSISTLLSSTNKTEKNQNPSNLSNESGWGDFFDDFNEQNISNTSSILNSQVKPNTQIQQFPKKNEKKNSTNDSKNFSENLIKNDSGWGDFNIQTYTFEFDPNSNNMVHNTLNPLFTPDVPVSNNTQNQVNIDDWEKFLN